MIYFLFVLLTLGILIFANVNDYWHRIKGRAK